MHILRLFWRDASLQHGVRVQRDRGTLRLFGANRLAYVFLPKDQLHFGTTMVAFGYFFQSAISWFSGDLEAMEDRNLNNVDQEGKDNRPEKRSTHHEQWQRRHGDPTIRHR